MENYQGDLTDIVRGSSSSATYGCKIEDPFGFSSAEWQFHPSMSNLDQLEQQPTSQQHQYSSFGDPFCAAAMRDPLLHELDMCGSSSSPSAASNSSTTCTFFNGGHDQDHDHHLVIKTPPSSSNNTNIFSRMLQISPSTNKFPISSPHSSPLFPNSTSSTPLINANSSEFHHFLDNTAVQISSPRNPTGIKRRKSQARKVVCVPAPVAASSRPNGEVIPSDLWAWRKYGQKPIKGSPYPRGYYRCSSSKGCSARKQVERSRTDPNMLVITYTSEHNHPWPTQRNALAGSSRSQQSKSSAPNSKLNPQNPTPDQPADTNKTQVFGAPTNVKEEAIDHQEIIQAEDNGDFSEGFQYMPTNNNNNNQSDDFFADLEELDTDPLNLLFSTGGDDDGQQKEAKFGLFDWAAENNNNNANSTSFEEAAAGKRGFY